MKTALQEADELEEDGSAKGVRRDEKGREIVSPEEKARRDEKARKVAAEVCLFCLIQCELGALKTTIDCIESRCESRTRRGTGQKS